MPRSLFSKRSIISTVKSAYRRYKRYLTLQPTKKPLTPASLKTEETVSKRVAVGLAFCIMVFMASKGMTHITLIKETKKEPTRRYLDGMF